MEAAYRLLNHLLAILVGLAMVVLALIINWSAGDTVAVAFGFVALATAYVVNLIGTSGDLSKSQLFACGMAVIVAWVASVASVIYAIINV